MGIKQLSQKRFISIILAGVFLVVSITGILMFFMVKSSDMTQVHSWLGMGFVFVGIYHLIKNLSSFKSYMKYTSSVIILIFIVMSSIWYIQPINNNFISPKKEIMNAVFTQPISTVCIFFKKDVDKVINKMNSKGVIVKDINQTLIQIVKDNNQDMKNILFIFFEE